MAKSHTNLEGKKGGKQQSEEDKDHAQNWENTKGLVSIKFITLTQKQTLGMTLNQHRFREKRAHTSCGKEKGWQHPEEGKKGHTHFINQPNVGKINIEKNTTRNTTKSTRLFKSQKKEKSDHNFLGGGKVASNSDSSYNGCTHSKDDFQKGQHHLKEKILHGLQGRNPSGGTYNENHAQL